jgi:hypothetical protein
MREADFQKELVMSVSNLDSNSFSIGALLQNQRSHRSSEGGSASSTSASCDASALVAMISQQQNPSSGIFFDTSGANDGPDSSFGGYVWTPGADFGQTSSAASSSADSSFGSDVQRFVQAVASGDTTTAQSLASSLKTRLSALDGSSNTSADASGANASSTDATSGGGAFLGDLKTLISDVQSGDTSSAQSLASSMQTRMDNGPPPPPMDAAARSSNASSTSDTSDASSAASFVADLQIFLQALAKGGAIAPQSLASSLQTQLASNSSPTTTSTSASGSGDTNVLQMLSDLEAVIASSQSGAAASTQQSAAQSLFADIKALGAAQS